MREQTKRKRGVGMKWEWKQNTKEKRGLVSFSSLLSSSLFSYLSLEVLCVLDDEFLRVYVFDGLWCVLGSFFRHGCFARYLLSKLLQRQARVRSRSEVSAAPLRRSLLFSLSSLSLLFSLSSFSSFSSSSFFFLFLCSSHLLMCVFYLNSYFSFLNPPPTKKKPPPGLKTKIHSFEEIMSYLKT